MVVVDFLYPGTPFSGETMRSASLGGIENSIVQLAEALARRGHDVAVFNGVSAPRQEFGVQWWPLGEANKRARGQIGIAVATPSAFGGTSFRSHFFWVHNPLKSRRIIRRGHFWPLAKRRPFFVVLGDYHTCHVPRWLPSKGRCIIHNGIQEEFFRTDSAAEAPPPCAIFTSQPYRGLDWLLDLWGEIKRKAPAATFDVFAPKAHQAAANAARRQIEDVHFCGNISRLDLIDELRAARVQLVPGHRDETYCLAAAEAIAAGVPVVTMGVGALGERVRDGKTGFIAKSKEDFIAKTAALLSDDGLWQSMHRECLAEATLATWDVRAGEWERLFAE